MTNNISIRQWSEHDWQIFKAIRLEAVSKHGNFFGASLDVESAYDEARWKERLSNTYNGAVFGLYDGDTAIGLTGIYRDWHGREGAAMLCMSYIREEYRGQGLSDLLYKARIDWAKAQGDIHTIMVGHREGNDASRAANQRWGFVFVKVEDDHSYGNGDKAKNYVYELKI